MKITNQEAAQHIAHLRTMGQEMGGQWGGLAGLTTFLESQNPAQAMEVEDSN